MTVCEAAARRTIPLERDIGSLDIYLFPPIRLFNICEIYIYVICYFFALVELFLGKGPDPGTGARSIPGPAEGPEPESAIPGLIQWCFTP